ncbi:MAG: hypothetical protein QT01_C0008G0025 [archaeon GW2011_AR6]|nr:MAG: hypothetical protein QT01_C0008G0025 [archaeon GW2011_AR6]
MGLGLKVSKTFGSTHAKRNRFILSSYALSMPARRKYSSSDLDRLLDSTFPDYETLVGENESNRVLVGIIKKKGNDDQKRRLKEILRTALIGSVRKLDDDELKLSYALKNHKYLEKACRALYSGADEKSPWRLLVEDAGRVYPCRQHKHWTLKTLLDEISSLGENPRESYPEIGERRIENIRKRSESFSGNFGKAAILAGVDFLRLDRIDGRWKSMYSFTAEDIEKVAADMSLSYGEKVACTFNIFALQYYELEARGRMSRSKSDIEGYSIRKQESFFDRPNIYVSTLQRNGEAPGFSVSMSLEGTVNTFYRQNFSFHSIYGVKEADFAIGFFHYIATSMRVLDQKLQHRA